MSINLLPWRENEINRVRRNFYWQLSACLVGVFCVIFFLHERNKLQLIKEDGNLERIHFKINHLKQLESIQAPDFGVQFSIDDFLVRTNQHHIDHLVDILKKIGAQMPEDVFLKNISVNHATIILEGMAVQTRHVLLFFRGLHKIKYLLKPHVSSLLQENNRSLFIFQAKIE